MERFLATEFRGKIELDIRDSGADWGPYAAPTAPKDAPNVLYIVWDDTGIATWDCFGGLVEMPAMSRIADRGVRLSQFHTTALCSPTRASLLTGRNATTVGMATIEEFTDGFPNCNGRIPGRLRSSPKCWPSAATTPTASASGTSRHSKSPISLPPSGIGRSAADSSGSTV